MPCGVIPLSRKSAATAWHMRRGSIMTSRRSATRLVNSRQGAFRRSFHCHPGGLRHSHTAKSDDTTRNSGIVEICPALPPFRTALPRGLNQRAVTQTLWQDPRFGGMKRLMTRNISRSSDGARAGKAPALDVFALRDSVVGEYKRFATSFTTIHAPDIREQVEGIYAGDRYWPEPLIQINPSYKCSTDVGALVESGVLDPGCADIFRAKGEAAVPLQAPAASHRARRRGRELRGDDRHGIRKVALLLHSHRQPRAERSTERHTAAHARHRRLPDERARQLPDG